MVALDHRRSAFSAFDHIRVNGALRECVHVSDFLRLLFKDPDEFRADDPALFLRLPHAGEL